ncbi:helix-hairpin-helix domain-containing protein [Microbacteriaceae bacterium 4G12]
MEKYKKWGILALALLILTGAFFWKTGEKRTQPIPIQAEAKKEKVQSQKEGKPAVILVDMKGAVKREGVYEIAAGGRVKEAVEKAGGFLPEADTTKVNLAQIVQDQMMIYIPRKGEQAATPTQEMQGKIAVNTATKEQLAKITGIGPKKAENIIRYREQKGPFQKPEDLLEVEGIGEKSLEKIKEQIIVP